MVIIDVREVEEFETGHRPGAINIPLSTFTTQIPKELAEIESSTPIGCYCVSGARSERAKRILENMGFKDVTNLGGI
jgi:phage shock protein E